MSKKPAPKKLKIVKGTQNCRINHNEPKPKKGLPAPPAHLDAEGKREWKRISKELDYMGLLTKSDRAALAAYCMAYARWVKAENKLRKSKDGLTVSTGKGYMIPNPLIGIANTAMKIMHKFLTEFGLTPSSRQSIEMTPKTGKQSDKKPGLQRFMK